MTDYNKRKTKTLKEKISIASVIVGVITYSYLVFATMKGTGEGLSFSTFALWAMLALITIYTTVKKGLSPAIPAIYGLGSTATSLVLLIKGRCYWSGFESFIAVLVLICVIIWLAKGHSWAFFASITAGVISSIPYIIKTWELPGQSPIFANFGFLITNILGLIAAKSWKLEDCLYNGINVVMCTFLIIPWFVWG